MKRRDFLASSAARTVLLAQALRAAGSSADAQTEEIRSLHTPGGIRVGLLGGKKSQPAPTLFVFATTIEETLTTDIYIRAGRLLVSRGFLCVSLDLPCHGADRRTNEPERGLACWRTRLDRGDPVVPDFVARISHVLDFLIEQGYSDPTKAAACGTSRGGFIAMRYALADKRVRCVAAFSPVTDLLALREFSGLDQQSYAGSLALSRQADSLAEKAVWMCIGNNDERVGTANAIALALRMEEAAAVRRQPSRLTLLVVPAQGHSVPLSAHEAAAKWIFSNVEGGESAT